MKDDATVIIETGCKTIKLLLTGDTSPKTVFPLRIAFPTLLPHVYTMAFKYYYSEDEIITSTQRLVIRDTIKNGIIKSCDKLEKIWHHTFYNKLRVALEEYPLLLTGEVVNDKINKEKITQIMFETFYVPALYIEHPEVLSLYSYGKISGIMLYSKDKVSRCVPFYNGLKLSHAVVGCDVVKRDLTDFMLKMLVEKCYNFKEKNEKEIARYIKEQLYYVAGNFNDELLKYSSSINKQYELPDGKVIPIDKERFICPEALFKHSLINLQSYNIHESLYNSISKNSDDIALEMFENVVLVGGNTMFSNIKDRLQKKLFNLTPSHRKVNVSALTQRQHAAYIGGSIFGTYENMKKVWITREEYDEVGPFIIFK